MLLVMIKIAFTDFWAEPKAFNPHNNFFLHCSRNVREEVKVVEPEYCDFLFYGPFGNQNKHYRDCTKIFYTGENVAPKLRQCDYALTFQPNSLGGRNYRLPLWYLYIDWFGVGTYDNPEWLVPREALNSAVSLEDSSQKLFCAIVYGKRVRSREQAIKHLSTYKPVDIYGKANPSKPIGDGEHAKLQVLAGYKFSLCYENSISPGYVTEKLLHGKACGGVPIYYGCDEAGLDFNPDCYIHATRYRPKELSAKIAELDGSLKQYEAIRREPLFREPPSLDGFYQALTSIFNGELIAAASPRTCEKKTRMEDAIRLRSRLHGSVKSQEVAWEMTQSSHEYKDPIPNQETWGCIIHHGDVARKGNRNVLKELLASNKVEFAEIFEQDEITIPECSWKKKVELIGCTLNKSISNALHQEHIGRLNWPATAISIGKECTRELVNIIKSGGEKYSALYRKKEIEQILRDKHVLAWKNFLARKENWLLVVEDDAIVTQEAGSTFQKVLMTDWIKQLRTTYLYLDLAGGYPMREVVKPTDRLEAWDGRDLWVSNKPSSSTTCTYLVTRDLVEKWVKRFERGGKRVKSLPVDHLINVLSKGDDNKGISYSIHWEPPVLIHGSMSGSFETSIDGLAL